MQGPSIASGQDVEHHHWVDELSVRLAPLERAALRHGGTLLGSLDRLEPSSSDRSRTRDRLGASFGVGRPVIFLLQSSGSVHELTEYAQLQGNTGDLGLQLGQAEQSSLTEQAYKAIEELIVTLQLKPGQILSEGALTRELGIGRTPIREALQRLAFEGLVVIMPRRGILVSEMNHSRQLALLELRREVERLVMREAARRATPAEREAFARLADDLHAAGEAGDDVAFMRLDLEFNHRTIRTCGNEFAARTMQSIQGLARRFWYRHYKEALDLGRCACLHEAVARAISQGDAEAAARASDELIDYMAEFTRATI